jgi:hypothetical protein
LSISYQLEFNKLVNLLGGLELIQQVQKKFGGGFRGSITFKAVINAFWQTPMIPPALSTRSWRTTMTRHLLELDQKLSVPGHLFQHLESCINPQFLSCGVQAHT